MKSYIREAEHFLNNESEYRLGFLPSEEANPITAYLDRDFADATRRGVETLLAVDRTLVAAARKALADARFSRLRDAMAAAMSGGNRIVFSGCGATGRLSILLEAAWRDQARPEQRDAVASIMTGGDYALVRSVEFFEDYAAFGRRQAAEMNLVVGDVLVGITATGETASILGTVMEAAERGAEVFLLICVPMEIPMNRLARCRQAYGHPRVTVLDMPCGGMAVAGSTRMQSTTLEMLVAGAALEEAAGRGIGHYAEAFEQMIESLCAPENMNALAQIIDFETAVYRENGLITYRADTFLLDILTDTTERSPTFMLPPFRRADDRSSPVSWAFVKNPNVPTEEAWLRCFRREPRCLSWTAADYAAMNAERLAAQGVPAIGRADLMQIQIGNEPAPERAGAIDVDISASPGDVVFHRPGKRVPIQTGVTPTALRLFEHLALKLVLNVISTGTMVTMGRVSGNWMTWLDVSNKKLIDRGIRIIADQCGLEYRAACYELFKSIEELERHPNPAERISPVQHTLAQLSRPINPGGSV